MRNYSSFDKHLDELEEDIYPQPSDPGHTEFAKTYLDWALPGIVPGKVLDIGCGQGFCKPLFEQRGFNWTGITLGNDYREAVKSGVSNIFKQDMTFSDLPSEEFSYGFARHVLEHSPFPTLTLMEWNRVITDLLFVVLPSPDYWGWGGKNHYSVFNKDQWWYTFTRAGWYPVKEGILRTNSELFMKYFHPEIKDRSTVAFPGHPKEVEWWFVLGKGEKRIE